MMADEHRCFEKLKDNYDDTAPFKRPVVIDDNLDFKTIGWHIQSAKKERLYRVNYCPFCGDKLEHDD